MNADANPTVQLRRISGIDPATLGLLERYFGLSLAEEFDVQDALETIRLTGETWLFRQNDPGDSLYFLVRGRLQAWRNASDADHEQQGVLLGEIVPGDSVGEAGMLSGKPRSAGVRAIRDSVLVRVNRDAFERLAKRNPTLIMKLASSVAERLTQNSSQRPAGSRPLRTIALVTLDRSPRVEAFCNDLIRGLGEAGRTLDLKREHLGEAGAPVHALGASEALDDRLKHWLHEQEFETRFVVYRADQASNPWSRYAVRQADLLVMVAEAGSNPLPRDWERQLIAGKDVITGSRRALVLLQPEAAKGIHGTAAWLDARRADFHLHVRADRPDDLQRVLRVLTGRATGLVMGAGAARGFAHLGVYRALSEAGQPIDWVGGASIGAIMACTIANDWSPQHAIDMAHAAFVKGKPLSDYTLPMVSLLSGGRLVKLTRKYLGVDIEDMPLPFFCVSSNLATGTLNVHERGPLWRAVRASAALPGVLPPVVHESQLVIDGAVLNTLPIDIMQTKPVGKVIGVDLSARKVHRIDYEEVPSAWSLLRTRVLPKKGPKVRVPSLATLMLKAIEIGTMSRVRELGARADLLICPPVSQFSMMDVKGFHTVVDAGYRHAAEVLPAWLHKQREPVAVRNP